MFINSIKLTEETDNISEVIETFNNFRKSYPGNFFIINESSNKKVFISWIPQEMIGYYLYSRLNSTMPFSVPMNWPK